MIAFIWGACGAVKYHADAFGLEHLIEQGGELAVPVSDQESEVVGSITQLEHQVAGLLRDPAARRVRRDTQHVDAPCGVLD